MSLGTPEKREMIFSDGWETMLANDSGSYVSAID